MTRFLSSSHTHDERGRVENTYHQIGDSGAEQTISERTYDDWSRESRKSIAKQGSYFGQSIDYTYNILGWLESINTVSNATIHSAIYSDLFSQELSYFTLPSGVSGVAQKSGNISAVQWRSHGDGNNIKAYGFEYDDYGRLEEANYVEKYNTSTSANDRYSVNNLTYDLNGNIETLVRKGKKDNGTYGIIDDLTYDYATSTTISHDQLSRISDAADLAAGFTAPGTGWQNFTYDQRGNLTAQDNSGITTLTPNVFNLPQQIVKSGVTTQIIYDGRGNKLAQHTTGQPRKDYLGGIEMSGTNFEAIMHEEGRVVLEGTWKYEYVLRDHLGNTRVVFRPLSGTSISVHSTHAYYPFGMENSAIGTGSSGLDYRYNGMERNEELGLDLAPFRSYDPAIGRWMQIDPMAEAMPGLTPYRFGFNNPISFADPSGLFEQNGGGDDPDKREVQYDENGKPTGVRLGYSDSSTGATSYPLAAVGGTSSGIGTLMQQRANYNYSGGTLPQASVTATAPDHLWKINGDFMTQEDAFAMARNNFQMTKRLLQEEFGTSTAIKFFQYDIISAQFDFANKYVNPLLSNIGPGGALKIGLAGAKYSGLFMAATGGLRVRKAAWGIKSVGSKKTFLYSAIGFKLGLRQSLGRKFPTLFGPPASTLHTAIGRNAIPIGLGTAGAAYGAEKLLQE